MRYLIVALIISLQSFSASAQTLSFECKVFDRLGKQKPMEMKFLVDLTNNKSYAVGNVAVSEVPVTIGDYHITFIEVTGSGNVMTTTIDLRPFNKKWYKVVHSRHFLDELGWMPSQWIGKCK